MTAERASPLWRWDAGPNWLGEVYDHGGTLEWVANSKIPPGGWGHGISEKQTVEEFLRSGPRVPSNDYFVPVYVIEDLRERFAPRL